MLKGTFIVENNTAVFSSEKKGFSKMEYAFKNEINCSRPEPHERTPIIRRNFYPP